LTVSKFFIIILSLILFYNTAVAVAKPPVLEIPDRGDLWLREIDNTIEKLIASNEKLIASNEKSSQKMKDMTSEIQCLTKTLVGLTVILIVISLLPYIILLFKRFLYRKRQNTIRKNEKKAYPDYRVRKKRFYLVNSYMITTRFKKFF
jgi:predicted PurR-regulated permease PerM